MAAALRSQVQGGPRRAARRVPHRHGAHGEPGAQAAARGERGSAELVGVRAGRGRAVRGRGGACEHSRARRAKQATAQPRAPFRSWCTARVRHAGHGDIERSARSARRN